ncbi:MAG: hypothetical protein WCA08_01370 [Desulfoferrobacter sp.]
MIYDLEEERLKRKRDLLNRMCWFKRNVREEIRQVRHLDSIHRNCRKLLSQNPGAEVLEEILLLSKTKEAKSIKILTDAGYRLWELSKFVDRLLTRHEQAQLLAISHIWLDRVISQVPERNPTFFELVFAYIAEYRGKSDFVPDMAPSLPLFTVARLAMLDAMTHPLMQSHLTEAFNEVGLFE